MPSLVTPQQRSQPARASSSLRVVAKVRVSCWRRPGRVSLHSLGNPEAPGAYDAVVNSMPLPAAAARLKQAGGAFSRVVAEGPHGGQGPHLHVELISTRGR